MLVGIIQVKQLLFGIAFLPSNRNTGVMLCQLSLGLLHLHTTVLHHACLENYHTVIVLVYLAECKVEVGSLPQLIYYNTGQIWQSVYSSSAGQLFPILLPTDEQLPYIVTETN